MPGVLSPVTRLLLVLSLVCIANSAHGWVYPEHRDIALFAVASLDKGHQTEFAQLWAEARTGAENRLCLSGADEAQGLAPACIDWAAMTALSGDHSCSAREMFEAARAADWVLQVAAVAAQLKVDLAGIPVTARPQSGGSVSTVASNAGRGVANSRERAQRTNALRKADLRLQRADPQYATRAGKNNAHFLLARPNTDMSLDDYAQLTLRAGSEISAVGVYASYHLSALQKATRLAHETLTASERAALARAAMADEAFALHFLEDVFAAGHIAGSWGSVFQRQGTHDYYNENGLEVFTWAGGAHSLVLLGDAHMRSEDRAVAGAVVRASLEQLLEVATGSGKGPAFPHTPAAPDEPDSFDVCGNSQLPHRPAGLEAPAENRPLLTATLGSTPIPGLGPGLGALPRFRSDVGFFVGLAASLDARAFEGGFVPGSEDDAVGGVGGVDVSVRAGLGLDGVMGQSGDGLVYVSVGFRSDSASTNHFSNSLPESLGGNLSASIPARTALATRFRLPFYLIPGDLLLLSPLYLINPHAYSNMAVTAANGGLIPWQAGWATTIGRFQLVLGRELGVTFYQSSQVFAPGATPAAVTQVIDFKSTTFDLPVVEYRPYRTVSAQQSSSLLLQAFIAADVPHGVRLAYPPGVPAPKLRTVWSFGLRLSFNWRYYP
ncbi:MAG TPA: hypothetical protein VF772_24715 [Terriglobales bacterium]